MSIFYEENKSLTTCVFQSYVIFLKMMCFQSDERGLLDILEIKLFLKPNHGGQTFKYFFLFVGFTLWLWSLCKFLEKGKQVNISPSDITRDSRNLMRGNDILLKVQYTIKVSN